MGVGVTFFFAFLRSIPLALRMLRGCWPGDAAHGAHAWLWLCVRECWARLGLAGEWGEVSRTFRGTGRAGRRKGALQGPGWGRATPIPSAQQQTPTKLVLSFSFSHIYWQLWQLVPFRSVVP